MTAEAARFIKSLCGKAQYDGKYPSSEKNKSHFAVEGQKRLTNFLNWAKTTVIEDNYNWRSTAQRLPLSCDIHSLFCKAAFRIIKYLTGTLAKAERATAAGAHFSRGESAHGTA